MFPAVGFLDKFHFMMVADEAAMSRELVKEMLEDMVQESKLLLEQVEQLPHVILTLH